MFTAQNVAIGITLVLFVWYLVGSYLNRRRSQQLINIIRQAVPLVGEKPTIKWYGRSAFQVDIGEPRAPFAGFHLLCVLEPRDFALAQAWNRYKGRRDQVLIRADLARAPRQASQPDPASYGVPGLSGVELKSTEPHLSLTLQVGAGDEGSVAQIFELARKLAV